MRSNISKNPSTKIQLPRTVVEHIHASSETTTIPPLEDPSQILSLHYRFKISSLGKDLSSNVRYERYKPSFLTNSEWINVIGWDACNMEHGLITYYIAKAFIQSLPAEYTEEDKQTLLLTSIVHDWAESLHGDVTHDEKTEEGTEREMNSLLELIEQFAPEHFTLASQAPEINKNPLHRLHSAFNAIEQIGYMRTQCRAWSAQKKLSFQEESQRLLHGTKDIEESNGQYSHLSPNQEGELKSKLQWISNNVLTNTSQPLLAYGKKFPFVAAFLGKNAHIIVDALQELHKQTEPNSYNIGSFQWYPAESTTTPEGKVIKGIRDQQTAFRHTYSNTIETFRGMMTKN